MRRRFPMHGHVGLGLIAVFWPLNWGLDGLRTHWGFFPLWLGYCLLVDGLNVRRRGTSLWTRNRGLYVGLFGVSIPSWWLFEAFNLRTGNWVYLGREHFDDLTFALLSSLAFSTVVPAVLGTAELVAGTAWMRRLGRGGVFPPSRRTGTVLAGIGAISLVLVLAWPRWFYPLVWIAVFGLLEPLNLALGHRTLLHWTGRGDWRPVLSLFAGVLVCGFFWEMWNFRSYPKWTYDVPVFGFWHVFEMPLLGYLGYLPFALELFALVHFFLGLVGLGRSDYVVAGLAAD